ncbi:MAG TPA: DUF998 domain-containing protein [Streptosporangiaceae bacterium]|nr:DUF998 domain-containing protein [Streptosporangiaceae bacterium]
MASGRIPGKPESWTRALLRCGLVAGPVFITAFLLEGAVRDDGYRPLRHPVSSLALGPRGWTQEANFTVTGALFLAAAAGLGRAGGAAAGTRGWTGPVVPLLVGAAGTGLISAAVFPTDPVGGYPPGTPLAPSRPTRTGTAHNLSAVPVFIGLPVAAATCGWRSWRIGRRGFAGYSAGTAVAMLVTMALAGGGFGGSPATAPRLVKVGGLFQRASIVSGFTWLTALSARALSDCDRATRSSRRPIT